MRDLHIPEGIQVVAAEITAACNVAVLKAGVDIDVFNCRIGVGHGFKTFIELNDTIDICTIVGCRQQTHEANGRTRGALLYLRYHILVIVLNCRECNRTVYLGSAGIKKHL